MNPVRFAVVGAGVMGAHHARNLAASAETRLAAIVDVDAARGASLAAELGCQAFADAAAALDALPVDAVVIATPERVRTAPVAAVLERRVPLFLEKPLAVDALEAERLAERVRASGVPFQIGFQRRFDPGVRAIRAAIDAGARVELLRSLTRDPEPPPSVDAAVRGGGMVHGTLIHDIDTALFLGGPIREVFAWGAALYAPEDDARWADTVVVGVRFASGALGTLEGSWRTAYGYDARAEVHSSAGSFEAGGWPAVPVVRHGPAGASVPHPPGFLERFEVAYRAELLAFARAVRGGTRPSPGVDDALAASRVAAAVEASLASGRPEAVRAATA